MTSDRAKNITAAAARIRFGGRQLVTARGIQIALGLVWLLDGLFQFKSFMFTHAIVTEVFEPAMHGQPSFIGEPMRTFADFYGRDLTLWNSLSGEVQIAIGLALMCSRRLVKPALTVSFAWAIFVWWFGEGFGGLTSNTLPAPLMGAPGAVILYAIIGLLVWPTDKRQGRSPTSLGPLGDRGGLYFWSGLWLVSAALWVANVNRAKEATHSMITEMAEASPHWLAKIQDSLAKHTVGHGTTIAIVLAIVSIAVAIGVWTPLRWPALAIGIILSIAYWLYGQDLGGPFWAEGATDFNAGPLFVLLAFALMPIAQHTRAAQPSPDTDARSAPTEATGARAA
jgi:hypothetical protein